MGGLDGFKPKRAMVSGESVKFYGKLKGKSAQVSVNYVRKGGMVIKAAMAFTNNPMEVARMEWVDWAVRIERDRPDVAVLVEALTALAERGGVDKAAEALRIIQSDAVFDTLFKLAEGSGTEDRLRDAFAELEARVRGR